MSHFLRSVRIRNYKSIADSTVELDRFTILVGRNASGKSNFLDALRFVTESLQSSLDHAIKARGGIEEVRRRSTGHPHNFQLTLDFNLPENRTGHYHFEVGAREKRGFKVKAETLTIRAPGGSQAGFSVSDGTVTAFHPEREVTGGLFANERTAPPAPSDRLYLVTVSGFPEFRPAYEALSTMGFYNLNPQEIRELQQPDTGELLRRDGGNLASVLGRLQQEAPQTKERISEYLRCIVPDIGDFERITLGPKETVRFSQAVKGARYPWAFYAAGMSDGTLRALGVLVAALQFTGGHVGMPLVGIEEPETALHPAASAALMEALREASENTQILVTTHSPDLLDRFDPEQDRLLVVESNRGTSTIDVPDSASLETIKTHLATAGELLRQDQLVPDALQRSLFDQDLVPE